MPSGSAADSQTRSRRRCPPGRYCQQAMNVEPADHDEREVQQPVAELDRGVQAGLPDAVRGDDAGLGALRPVGTAEPRRRQPHRLAGGDDDRVGDHRRERQPAHRIPRRPQDRARDARKPGRHAPHRNAWGLSAGPPRAAPPRAAPPLATVTQQIPAHSAALSRCPSIASPISAATAGCRLIHTPNTRGGTRRSASNSSQYGITDDSSPIAAPGEQQRRPEHPRRPRGDPGPGDEHRRHAHRDHQPGRPGHPLPGGPAEQDVAGPADGGQQRPRHARQVQVPARPLGEQQHARGGQRHPGEAEDPRCLMSTGARHRDGERPEELDGDRDPEGDPLRTPGRSRSSSRREISRTYPWRLRPATLASWRGRPRPWRRRGRRSRA